MLLKGSDGNTVLRSSDVEMSLDQSPILQTVLRMLFSGGATEEQLLDSVSRRGGSEDVQKVAYYLRRLIQNGMLCHTVTWNGIRLAMLVPLIPSYPEIPDEPAAETRYVLSRFSYLRRDGEQFVLESPLATAKIVLYDWRVISMLSTLATPRTLDELCSESEQISPAAAVLLVRLLLRCQAVSLMHEAGYSEEETGTLAQWEFQDLLFHTASRLGRHTNPYGSTCRFVGRIDPLPAVKTTESTEVFDLYKPDLEALCENDTRFTRVLEERRSIRRHGEQPITAEQLGEFFYRTARLRALSQGTPESYERSDRPYPNGGGCYELELYVVVNHCEGLSTGLYHYCPRMHQLCKLAGSTQEVEALLVEAYHAADQQGMPQILIILAARFQRVAWKYSAMAYALILKHVGVFYQTMYLVATAMGLAPCALGGGNSDIFVAAAGTDYYAETSVGEFILGTKAK